MLYSEFIENVGCKDNAENHEVYSNLNILYTNSGLTKEKIYEYGRKLVNNGMSEEDMLYKKELEERVKVLILELSDENNSLAYYKSMLNNAIESGDKDLMDFNARMIKAKKGFISTLKKEIAKCKKELKSFK
jgi:hypothetical protein